MNTYAMADMTASDEILVMFAGIMGAYAAIVFAVLLAVVILMILSTWIIFRKAGQRGWKALIPVYSDYIFYKIAWKRRWFWINVLLSAIAFAVAAIPGGGTAEYYLITSIASTLLGIFILIIEIIMHVKLAKSFRKDGGFAVGLILLPFIFFPILAFGSAKYRRKKKRRVRKAPAELPEA